MRRGLFFSRRDAAARYSVVITRQPVIAYDIYGNTTADAASGNPFQYRGGENDGTGLYYYRARYYSPQLQRFISEDPIKLAGGINTYAYVGGNPMSLIDPLGLAGAIPKDYGKNKPIGPLPDPSKDMRGKNDKAENLPDGVKGVLCALGLGACIPDEAFVCLKARCVVDCKVVIMDYMTPGSNAIPAGSLFPPSPNGVPGACECISVGPRINGPQMHPPGL